MAPTKKIRTPLKANPPRSRSAGWADDSDMAEVAFMRLAPVGRCGPARSAATDCGGLLEKGMHVCRREVPDGRVTLRDLAMIERRRSTLFEVSSTSTATSPAGDGSRRRPRGSSVVLIDCITRPLRSSRSDRHDDAG